MADQNVRNLSDSDLLARLVEVASGQIHHTENSQRDVERRNTVRNDIAKSPTANQEKTAMADPVSNAKHQLKDAVHERQEKAAVWWQGQIIEGRVIRQARTEMQAGERQTSEEKNTQQTRRTPRQPRTS